MILRSIVLVVALAVPAFSCGASPEELDALATSAQELKVAYCAVTPQNVCMELNGCICPPGSQKVIASKPIIRDATGCPTCG